MEEQVLALLNAHKTGYLSGETMSQNLGVSRAAVWKAIKALRQEGYEIDSAPKRGYRLVSAPDVLREGELTAGLGGCLLGREICCLPTVDSTNNEAKRLAVAGAPEGLVVLADRQTGGRGRRGRSFQSPEVQGLYLSVLLRPEVSATAAVNLTAWVAVAICDGVEEACGVRPGIKWPNDIILEGRKLCGILTEMELEGETGAIQWVVAGIGTNVSQKSEDFEETVRPVAVSLAMAGHPVRRAELALAQLRALDRMYRDFLSGQVDSWLARYRQDCLTIGRQVLLLQGERREEAQALEIDDEFSLVVRLTDGPETTVRAGEVSVRGLLGYL